MGAKKNEEDEDSALALALQAPTDQDEAAAREHGRVVARYYTSLKHHGVPAALAGDLTRYYVAWYLGETMGQGSFEIEIDDEDE